MKIIVVDRKKALSVMFLLILAVLVLFNLLLLPKNASGEVAPGVRFITINEGDTLWSIAEANNNSNTDIRQFIHQIKSVNNIGSNEFIQAGQVLSVPLN